MRRWFFCILALLLLSTPTCFSQQTDIRQFVVFGGYSYLHTPSLNLAQRGFNTDVGTNVRPWLSFGLDFSYFTGSSTLLPSYLNSATQARLAQLLPPGVPPSAVAVPYSSSTYEFQLGPQFNYRRLRKVTLFVRPALGLLHAKIQTNPSTAATPLVKVLLAGKLSAADDAPFYGFGGGATWEIHPNFGLRATVDFVHYNFFSNTLNGGRNSLRLSVGPKFSFGRNILEK